MCSYSYTIDIDVSINISRVTTYINYVTVPNTLLNKLLVSLVYEFIRKHFLRGET
jgi:hypothetical protein